MYFRAKRIQVGVRSARWMITRNPLSAYRADSALAGRPIVSHFGQLQNSRFARSIKMSARRVRRRSRDRPARRDADPAAPAFRRKRESRHGSRDREHGHGCRRRGRGRSPSEGQDKPDGEKRMGQGEERYAAPFGRLAHPFGEAVRVRRYRPLARKNSKSGISKTPRQPRCGRPPVPCMLIGIDIFIEMRCSWSSRLPEASRSNHCSRSRRHHWRCGGTPLRRPLIICSSLLLGGELMDEHARDDIGGTPAAEIEASARHCRRYRIAPAPASGD